MQDSQDSVERALVLGGGGPVGRAWQIGLIAGLRQHGLELASADRVIGTSAGSVVGAELLLDVEFGAETLQATQGASASPDADAFGGMLAKSVEAVSSPDPRVERTQIGAIATAARTMSEDDSLGRSTFRNVRGMPFPSRLHVAAVSTTTGEAKIWTAADQVPLELALAASTALPGVWPPITLGGDRYMDGGVRSMINADLAAPASRALVISCFAIDAADDATDATSVLNRALQAELSALVEEGSLVEVLTPDKEMQVLTANGTRMLDSTLSKEAFTAGRRQAARDLPRVRALWNTGD